MYLRYLPMEIFPGTLNTDNPMVYIVLLPLLCSPLRWFSNDSFFVLSVSAPLIVKKIIIIAVSYCVCKKCQVTLLPEFLPPDPDLWTSIMLKNKLASTTDALKLQCRGSMVSLIIPGTIHYLSDGLETRAPPYYKVHIHFCFCNHRYG